MAYAEILYDVSDRIATLTLNRPEKLNAWTNQMGADVRGRRPALRVLHDKEGAPR